MKAARTSKKSKLVKKTKVSKKLFFAVLLIPAIFLTLLFLNKQQTYQQHAQAPGCGAVGDAGNEKGVGKYCTKGGGQCGGTGSPFCSADLDGTASGLCSKQCSTDTDCGAGAYCFQDTLGKGCKPMACDAPSAVPSPACLGNCPTIDPSQPTATPAGQNNGGGGGAGGGAGGNADDGGGGDIWSILLGLLMPLLQPLISVFSGLFGGLAGLFGGL